MATSSVGSSEPVRVRTGTGTVLAERYELLEQVGAGGMATVWRARDRLLERDVAVKLLGDRSSSTSFEREARALAAITHPNVVTVFDIGEDAGGGPFIVMELVEGPDLAELIASRAPLGVEEAVRIVSDVLAGLGHAHQVGVVHGDVKPANVIVAGDRAKVADLGVARILGTEGLTTSLAATPLYAAPEVLRGQRPTEASDVYSAGCILFEVLTGRPPFSADGVFEAARRHLEDPVPDLGREDVPVRVEDALRRGMAKDPASRHASADDFAAALEVAGPDVVPAASPGVTRRLDATEQLPGGKRDRLVPVLGPLAPGWRRVVDGGRRLGRRWPAWATWTAVAIVAALLVASVGTGGDGEAGSEAPTVVPDVRGELAHVAVDRLRGAGLEVSGSSFRPQGEPGTVLETIPAAGEEFEAGEGVHLVVGAIRVPEAEGPVRVAPDEQVDDDDDDRGRGRGGGPKR